MQILKLKGFLFEPNDPAIYDRDSKTVLELCGRLGYKINELIDEYNRFYEEMNENYQEAYDYMVTHLGLFVSEQLPIIAPGIMEELWGTDIDGLLQDMADLKAEYKYYNGINDLKETGDQAPVGALVKTRYYSAPGDKGGALYEVVDHLEEGEVANNEDIIALGETLDPTKWAKMIPGDIVKSTSFLSLQSAVNYAYKHNLDVLICRLEHLDSDLIIPFSEDTPTWRIRLIGVNNLYSGIQTSKQIKLHDDTTFVNFSLENLYLEETDNTSNLLGELNLDLLAGTTINFISDCYIVNSMVTIYHGNGLTIRNNTLFNSVINFSESTDCKIFHNSFIHDGDSRWGNCVATTSCFNLTFENNTFNSTGSDICESHYQTSNCSFQNETFNMMSNTETLISFDHCSHNDMSDIYIGGTLNYTKIFSLEYSNNNSFTNIKSIYTNLNPSGCLFNIISSDYNTFENVELSDKTGFLITNTSANNFIRGYEVPVTSPLIYIVESVNASNNTIELAIDTDVERLHASNNQPLVKFIIPSEVKYGDTATMNSLYDYDGRIYYNTETMQIMICENHVWSAFGGSGGGSDAPITTIELVNGYYMNDMENNFSADLQLIGEALLDHYNSYGNRGFIYFKNPTNTPQPWQANVYTLFEFRELDTTSTRFRISKPFINRPQDFKTANSDVLFYDFYYSSFNPLTMSSVYNNGTITKTLATDNDAFYEPQDTYNPATKGYVDYHSIRPIETNYMPAATLEYQNRYMLYVGDTDANYEHLHIYTAVYDSSLDYLHWKDISYEDLTSSVSVENSSYSQLQRVKFIKTIEHFHLQGAIQCLANPIWNSFKVYIPWENFFKNAPQSSISIPLSVSTLINFSSTPGVCMPVYSYIAYNPNASQGLECYIGFNPMDNYSPTLSVGDSVAFNVDWTYQD